MHYLNYSLTTKSIAELALIISRMGPYLLDESVNPSVESLRRYWQSTRSLEHRWTKDLAAKSGPPDITLLEKLGPRIFLCESVTRLWSTVLASLSIRCDKTDLTRLARNSVCGLSRVRNEFLSQTLKVSETDLSRLVELDRLRRRSERWTDLLLGPIVLRSQYFEFACDRDRAREFSQDGILTDRLAISNAYEHLVSAGLRLTFNLHLSAEPIDEPEFGDLMQSILVNIPHDAFSQLGTLRTMLERRIAFGRQRLECRATADLNQLLQLQEISKPIKIEGSFLLNPPSQE